MKKIIFAILLTFSISNAKTPEFDGVYIQTKNNHFIEFEEGFRPDLYMNYVKRLDSDRVCGRGLKIVNVKINSFKYLVLKGQRYYAEHFDKQVYGNTKDELCESYDKKTLKVRRKSKGDTEFYQLKGIKKGDIYQFISSPYRYYIKFI